MIFLGYERDVSIIETQIRRQARLILSFRSLFDPLRVRPAKRPIHFLHISKTGGTALTAALQPFTNSGAYHIVIHDHDTRLRDVPPGQGFIFFLRDPVSRFVSGFNSRLRQGQPRFLNPWSPVEKTAFGRFPSPNRLARALDSKDQEERAAAVRAMHGIRHLPPVCRRWFGCEADFLARLRDVFFIGFQETLAEDFTRLKAKLGLPADLSLPTDEVAAHRTPDHFDKKLEPQAVENLQRWYERDIQFFQLCRQLVAENKIGQTPSV